jgi:hypothetical protein
MLRKILPKSGHYCAATLLSSGAFRHKFFTDIDKMQDYIEQQDELHPDRAMYLAQASFETTDNRKAVNVHSVRSFWMDIDCGATKPFSDQKAGAVALRDFCQTTGLPMPSVVNSGNGLYAHWAMTEDIPLNQWKAAATILKGLTASCQFPVDDSRTSDASSVLRPIGTHNRKDMGNPKPVKLIIDRPPIAFTEFVKILMKAGKKNKVSLEVMAPPKLNNEFIADIYDGPPSDPVLIFHKCSQIKQAAMQQEMTEEPVWYAMLGLLRHCGDKGLRAAHKWSEQHPDYSPEKTTAKISQHERNDVGPTTCAAFGRMNPSACVGCPHKDKITSPIQLGRVYQDATPTVEDKTTEDGKIELPQGFRYTSNGLVAGDEEPILFYDRELYVTELAYDESLGYETATVRHHLPHNGWEEFRIRSSITNDPKTFHMAMADNQVQVVGVERKKCLLAYIENFMLLIQRRKKTEKLVCQMGWKDDGRFVIGSTLIGKDGSDSQVSLAAGVPAAVEAFHTKGDPKVWTEATKVFNKPELLPMAFAFVSGAFGAPLMRFTGYPGGMVAMLGPSGTGKTLTGMFMASTYGRGDKLIMLKDDTKNALISRLGAYGSLPLYMDEITNIDPNELSELAYRVTQGRDKTRLTRSAVERKNVSHWQTLAVVSSNASIVDKLSNLKQDASAELNRVFEFWVASHDVPRAELTEVYRKIKDNYGHAGIEYIKYVAAHQDEHQAHIDRITADIDKRTSARSDERYWSAIAATAIYGATIAKKLGLIDLDIASLFRWTVNTINTMRKIKHDVVSTPIDSLGQFLDEFASSRLVVNQNGIPVVLPKGALSIRVESGEGRMYISRSKLRDWCSRNYASYASLRDHLKKEGGPLVNPNRRRALGQGTEYAGAPQPCWEIDLKNPAMGIYTVQLLEQTVVAKRSTT